MNIKELAGQSANITYTYKVTSEIYYSFQRCSNDYNPLHTDEIFAKEKGFNGKVMYGNILNCFISYFVGMLLPTRNVIIQSQDINFHQPIYLNDEIILNSTIDTISEAVNIINYKIKFYKVTESSSKSIMVAKGHVQIGLLK